ncbi:MAG: hypothetical protein IIZ93_14200 [Acidaminococcaceae bacterium]|nr:hypothetical protein [Acidaminococcaceae bacterium]
MKDFETIRTDRKFVNKEQGEDGGMGWLTVRGTTYFCIYSNGGGWDHVSVSLISRCPTWGEMCDIKNFFFREDEVCVEYHPSKSNYVNIHKHCLHLWRPQDQELPVPPVSYV